MPKPPSSHDIFEILIREHADMLTAYLRSLGADTSSIDDLFQESVMVAWRRLSDFDRERSFGRWLRGIARNVTFNHRRKIASSPARFCIEVIDTIDAHFNEMAHNGARFGEHSDKLLDCLKRLPEQFAQVIDLHYARGLRLRDAAQAISENEETLKKRLQRARQSLFDCMTAGDLT